jgi:anion-transporting  ArsA/GET3 family ATPase
VILDGLLEKRLVVISGKGGVGKSVTGAALALAAVKRGRRTLLVEVDSPLEATRYLGAQPAGGGVREARPGLFTVNLAPTAVMDEYVRHVVKLELLARRILDSPVYHRFFAAAPGLRELMVLGKIMTLEEEREGWSRRPRYDLLIVDAPATGHGLSFLKVPQAASQAVPVGPIGVNARRIQGLLRDPRRTALLVVAIPEEMAVVEAAWFHRLATDELGIACAGVVLNAASEERFSRAEEAEVLRLKDASPALAPALAAARRQIRRRKRTRFYEKRLAREIEAPLLSLPFLPDDPIGPGALQRLVARFEAG